MNEGQVTVDTVNYRHMRKVRIKGLSEAAMITEERGSRLLPPLLLLPLFLPPSLAIFLDVNFERNK